MKHFILFSIAFLAAIILFPDAAYAASGLTASSASKTQTYLTWTTSMPIGECDDVSRNGGYITSVCRADGGTFLTYDDTGLTCGTNYSYDINYGETTAATSTWACVNAPNTPTLVSPADNVWANSRAFCASTYDGDGGNVTNYFVIGGAPAATGTTVTSGTNSCYTHTADLNSVTWYAYSSDGALTSATTSLRTAKVDATAPTNITFSGATTTWAQTASSTVTATDALSGLQAIYACYSIGQACVPYPNGPNPTSTPFSGPSGTRFALTADGNHTLWVMARDNAGSLSAATPNGDYRRDTAPPTTSTLSAAVNGETSVSWTSGTFSDALSGSSTLGSYGFSTDNSAFSWSTSTTWSETGLACATSYTRYLKHRDAALNQTGSVSLATTTASCTAPPAPTSTTVTETNTGSTQATVSWSGSSDGFNVYDYLITAASSTRQLKIGSSTEMSVTVSNLQCPQIHVLEVVSWKNDASLGGSVDPTCGAWNLAGKKCSVATSTVTVRSCTRQFFGE
ncbi:MAG: hypothetical protein V1885_03280 [Candidatus Brennerbacteria bacterium]